MARFLTPAKRSQQPSSKENWFDRFWQEAVGELEPLSHKGKGLAAVDVFEDESQVAVRAEVPGLSQKDIEVKYQNGALVIRGNKKEEKEQKESNRYYHEISYGEFEREIPLRPGLDWSRAKASYKNGVLDISIPKTEKEQKKIDVKIG